MLKKEENLVVNQIDALTLFIKAIESSTLSQVNKEKVIQLATTFFNQNSLSIANKDLDAMVKSYASEIYKTVKLKSSNETAGKAYIEFVLKQLVDVASR